MTKLRNEIERDRSELRRMIATLCGLAETSEMTARRPWPVRCLALMILRCAELVARGMVGHVCEDFGHVAPVLRLADLIRPDLSSQTEALRLAQCFRALAATVERVAADPELGRARPSVLARIRQTVLPDRLFGGHNLLWLAQKLTRRAVTSVDLTDESPMRFAGRLLRAYPAPS